MKADRNWKKWKSSFFFKDELHCHNWKVRTIGTLEKVNSKVVVVVLKWFLDDLGEPWNLTNVNNLLLSNLSPPVLSSSLQRAKQNQKWWQESKHLTNEQEAWIKFFKTAVIAMRLLEMCRRQLRFWKTDFYSTHNGWTAKKIHGGADGSATLWTAWNTILTTYKKKVKEQMWSSTHTKSLLSWRWNTEINNKVIHQCNLPNKSG